MRRRRYLALAGAGLFGGCLQAPRGTGTQVETPGRRTEAATATVTATDTETATETPDDPDRTRVDGVSVQLDRYDLRELSYDELPQSGHDARVRKVCATGVDELDEERELETATVDGQTGLMPLRTGRSLLQLVTCYREHGDERFLETAAAKAKEWVDVATEHDGALYFPYGFDNTGAGVELEAPWYSGITQGPALSAFLRLHRQTGDEAFREAAERTYRSFRNLKRHTDGPWTAMVEDDYYWIEEYPHDPPTHVLNGFLIGLWGLYEYWLDRRTEESRELVQAAVTTVADHLDEYRAPGEVSWYALNRGYRGNAFYHSVHVHQLGQLYAITGDDYFREMRETYVDDHETVPVGG